MEANPAWPWIASAVLFLLTLYLVRRRFFRQIENAVSTRGFADDSEEITLILKDGTSVKTTWGAVKKRVKGNHRFLLSPARDWVIGGIYCAISIAVPLVVGYLFPMQSSG